ncbi:phage holin family protein [Clostridium weizhouense]|uniref:Phage holin family protein n=1 Tax=Clostridium weizhouense TaxID=2859781 RepID=A0ABS7APG7_9CLOT|nr:phage holin family protein [Clostridium weizhouense]MBW6410556.1 phage holin family protein [Clostridium weizhouense]
MDFMQYITENALILIPALYIVGLVIKNTESISDKYIPLILLFLGVIGAILLIDFTIEAVIQGILVTGATVYTNQLFKQSKKDS